MEFCHIFKPAKLLISFMDRHRGDHLVKVTKKAGARGGTIIHGRAQLDSRLLRMFSLADIDQDIVLTIMGRESEDVLAAIKKAASQDPKKLGGLAIVLDVSGMLFRVPGPDQDECGEREESDMQSGYKLLTIIVNHGYADDVMAEARKAGAQGGTIITGRGTGTEEDVKFFGVSLVPEKEILMIVAQNDTVPAILKSINSMPEIQQPGVGVVYNMNIEQFMPLGLK